MIRWLYIVLLRLHPRRFRQRFGDEMLWIFDESTGYRGVAALFADGVRSLFRQWMLRPEPARQTSAAHASDGVPVFYTGGGDTPRRSALIQGVFVSLVIFWSVSYVITHGRSRGPFSSLLIGSHNHSFSHLLPARSLNAAPRELDVEIKVKPEPLAHKIPAYFRLMPVLTALDVDEDGVISAVEISNAAVALRTLDRNHDGKLSAEECGLRMKSDPPVIKRARVGFMRLHPVLAVLDVNHDGEIDASELRNASARLSALDQNDDGKLTVDELLPDPVANLVSMILFALDKNGDGVISKEERANSFARRFSGLLDHADRNRDGFVSEQELANEIRFRATLYKDGIVDLRRLEKSAR